MKHTGSCLCGAVTFEVNGEFDALYLCHCERCRKDTGSAHAANLFSTSATLTWLGGADCARVHNFKGEGHIKGFCTTCGSALPTIQLFGGVSIQAYHAQGAELNGQPIPLPHGAALVVPAGSLDSDVPIRPTAHIYCAHRANWDTGLELVPCHDTLPPEAEQQS